MPKKDRPVITGAVEGMVDEAVLRRLIREAGGNDGPMYGQKGKGHLLKQLENYNRAANYSPWAILVDLDQDEECAPRYFRTLLTVAIFSNGISHCCSRG